MKCVVGWGCSGWWVEAGRPQGGLAGWEGEGEVSEHGFSLGWLSRQWTVCQDSVIWMVSGLWWGLGAAAMAHSTQRSTSSVSSMHRVCTKYLNINYVFTFWEGNGSLQFLSLSQKPVPASSIVFIYSTSWSIQKKNYPSRRAGSIYRENSWCKKGTRKVKFVLCCPKLGTTPLYVLIQGVSNLIK